jgi:hypothetical protein
VISWVPFTKSWLSTWPPTITLSKHLIHETLSTFASEQIPVHVTLYILSFFCSFFPFPLSMSCLLAFPISLISLLLLSHSLSMTWNHHAHTIEFKGLVLPFGNLSQALYCLYYMHCALRNKKSRHTAYCIRHTASSSMIHMFLCF